MAGIGQRVVKRTALALLVEYVEAGLAEGGALVEAIAASNAQVSSMFGDDGGEFGADVEAALVAMLEGWQAKLVLKKQPRKATTSKGA